MYKRQIVNTADCAIGRDAARLVLDGLDGFRDDYEEHIIHHRCLAGLQLPVPCVALCPAGVDVPGYMALVGEGRCADAVRLIRKDNPFPVACAYICEHPCEARCRRNMIDDAINIRGLKRYAVDHAGDVPQPVCAPPTGKKVAIIGGGPTGIAAAYFCGRAGIETTIFERESCLGGVPRHVIPGFRIANEVIEKDIALMERYGVEVKCGAPAPSVDELKKMGYTQTPENPVAMLNNKYCLANANDYSGNVEVDYKIHGFEDLHLHASIGAQYTDTRQDISVSRYSRSDNYYGWEETMGYWKYNIVANAYAQYAHKFGVHDIDIMGLSLIHI